MISVIIPVYNRQDMVEEAIQSVFKQTYQNFEIILIENGSTDHSWEVCSGLAQKDSRVRLLRGEKPGVSAARNMGLDAAKGKYLFFLDSDDVIHPRLLETLRSGLEASDGVVAGTSVANIDQKNWMLRVPLCVADPAEPETVYIPHEKLRDLFMTISTPITLIGGVLIRRDWVGDTRFREDLFIAEDYYFVYENMDKGANGVFLRQKWYFARIHSNRISRRYDYEGFLTRFHRWELVWRNEELNGRQVYANSKKRAAFQVYLQCLRRHSSVDAEVKKMRDTVRKYKAELRSGLPGMWKLRFWLYVNFPILYIKFHK